ncbi:sulfatase [Chryseolinea sp. T2]|uniref:sulfatase family protein n=1 Tax=Chryseolinea sp. T2 TaxID=3129255 RepID=UPI0030789C95
MKNYRQLIILILLNLSVVNVYAQSHVTPAPNIVLIFLDDMGNGDLGLTGATNYATPSIDKMGMEGIRFTNFLTAQAVCSASRAGLLTGCYPNRIGFSGALFPNSPTGINSSEVTLAELVKQKGYSTAIVGKWHLGDSREFLPLQHGFDEYFGLPYSNDMWPVDYAGKPATDWKKDRFPPLFLIDGNEKKTPVETLGDQSLLTQRYTQRAVDFIKRNKKNPFFLYLAHNMPHVPINASAQFKGKSKQGLYGDVMMEIDWSVGEVLKALRENGLDNKTIVIFTSDNGPWMNYGNHAGSTGGLREAKGSSFEGGMRVPCLMRWKGTIQGGLISNSLSSTIDIFPTIAELLQLELPTHKIDGVSLVPIIKGDVSAEPRKEFYYYYRKNNLEAVRLDQWKLVLPHPGRTHENYEPGKDGYPGDLNENFPFGKALYDLRRDPGERYDVKTEYPEIVKELEALAEKAREDLGDDLSQRVGKNVRIAGVKQP